MARSIRFAAASLSILLFAVIVGSATPASAGESVRVYTNADLALLSPIPEEPAGPPPAAGANDEDNWKFVNEFISSQHARIDADRSHELERERVVNEADDPGGFGVPYLGYYGNYLGRYPYRSSHVNHRGRNLYRSQQLNLHAPHKMFRNNPPVRQHVPGLGNSYRRAISTRPARGHRQASH